MSHGPSRSGNLSFTFQQVRKNVNSDLQMLGAVINLYKPQRNLSSEVRKSLESFNSKQEAVLSMPLLMASGGIHYGITCHEA
jgi:hypothetical protein